MNKRNQVADQSGKGAILGVLAAVLAETSLDAATITAILTLAGGVLAWLSTLIGNRAVASFLDR